MGAPRVPDRQGRRGRLIAVALAVLCAAGVAWKVDLNPQVDPSFFFSSDDPQLDVERRISKTFRGSSLMILSAKGDVRSEDYLRRVRALTLDLRGLPGVKSVYSLAEGPKDLDDAFRSPLWGRLLIGQNGDSSHLLVFLDHEPSPRLVRRVELMRNGHDAPGFELLISGVPYVSEMIRRNLSRDLGLFSALSFCLFALATFAVFRSARMVFGTAVACAFGAASTLLIARLFGIRIGLLTANLVTILFVLTLSHIFFLNFNWRSLGSRREAVRETLEGAFWSTVTAVLGFLSLLLVQAIPLRWLGISGAIGTVMTFVATFWIYPWFLPALGGSRRTGGARIRGGASGRFFRSPRWGIAGALAAMAAAASLGVSRIDADPSLLSYFAEGSELHQGLEHVDQNLGSSPLSVVVRDASGQRLNTSEAYRKLWRLHDALERDPAVGGVISLPLMIAEAKRNPLASILPNEWLFRIMEGSRFSDIAQRFVTQDRRQGFFVVLMRESGRGHDSRLETAARVREIVRDNGFEPEMVGGVYMLQGRLSRQIVSSSGWSMVALTVLFLLLGWALLYSARVALGVLVCLAMITVWMVGVMGHMRIPFDVISSPASNIAVGLGVDAMMHMICFVRRAGSRGWDAWVEACAQLWRPIVFSALIVCAGFSVFGLSAFPPTQRFGLAIVIGTLIEPLVALFVFPLISAYPLRRRAAERRPAAEPPLASAAGF